MQLITDIMNQLVADRCSDLYILPNKQGYQLLAMGNNHPKWQPIQQVSTSLGQQIITFFKYRANMAVSEHRRPQGGSWRWQNGHHEVDLRLSTIGDFQSRESLVIRFIYRLVEENYRLAFISQWEQLQRVIQRRGLILFAGPMGSGKTTTMYRLAREQADQHLVMTIEDPVEIHEPRFLQLQVNQAAGMDYQALLRAGLRHRPNTFIIGEIRDHITAEMAVQAALSGHLVFATIHARNADGVITRLRELQVDQSYLENAVTCICYQRLLPMIDRHPAVLFEMLASSQLNNHLMNQQLGGISHDWQERLTQLQQRKKITTQTMQTFWEG